MKFNDTGNTHDSLVHYVNDLLGVTNNEYSLAWKARATNTSKYMLALDIWRAQDSWDFDDSTKTDFPISTATLVASQEDYALPTTALEVKRVEVKNASGDFEKLQLIDETNIKVAMDEFHETDGMPRFYRLFGRSIFLYPAPSAASTTLTNGLKVTHNREIVEFTAATTTTEVGMTEPGDRIVSYMVAREFAAVKGMDNNAKIKAELTEMTQRYLAHISRRSRDEKPRIFPATGGRGEYE